MRLSVGFTVALVLALTTTHGAFAQQPAAPMQPPVPQPILRTTIDPPRVVVGQKTRLRIEVLAPNYMTAPPVMPEFQIRNAVTRQLQNLNLNERHDGLTYAGVRFEFAVYPQEPGSYAVADQTITMKYAAEPPQTREATLSLPRIEFEAFIPDAAVQLDPFVSASRLTIEQAVQRSSDQLKTGDSVIRTVTIKAEGTPAMLLPPTAFAATDGLALYPAQPSVQDHTDARTDVVSATRVDAATFMLEKPGDYLLPAIVIRWWNTRTEKIETARLDTIELHVVDNPLTPRSPGEEPQTIWNWNALVDFVVGHWALLLVVILALAALAWVLPRTLRSGGLWYRHYRDALLASEVWAFGFLMATARHRPPGKVYGALLDWIGRFQPIAPDHTIKALKAAAQAPDLDRQIAALETGLFGPRSAASEWSARRFFRALSSTRFRLLRQASPTTTAQPLPSWLNPIAIPDRRGTQRRPIAR